MHRGGCDCGDEGRSDPIDHGGSDGGGGGPEGQHQRDDPQPQEHDPQEQRAGVAENEPGKIYPHAAGSQRSGDGFEAGPVGADAARERPARRFLHPGEGRRRAQSRAARQLRLQAEQAPLENAADRRGPGGAMRLREEAHSARGCPRRLHPRLLEQSQSLTKELQSQQEELKETNDRLEQQAQNLQNSERLLKNQQEELQHTNEQLQVKAKQLSEQMKQVEYKNREVEQAKAALEEKAEQLALSSRYKSEFLPNMSHELRTPLNSLLILAKLLADNAGNNLMPKQIDYAQTIYAAGTDLLSLINDILDLAKIESGTVTLDIGPERLSGLRDYVERTFLQVAQDKDLGFTVDTAPGLPAVIYTDEKRLQQILKNLLSNAIKFTEKGKVDLRISLAKSGWTPGHAQLDAAERVVAFAVTDTGIGIPENKKRVIFEAFQQADGTTSRKYGGTGLGLSISRELTRLLGGEIRVESTPGKGSTFTLYLPFIHEPTEVEATIPKT